MSQRRMARPAGCVAAAAVLAALLLPAAGAAAAPASPPAVTAPAGSAAPCPGHAAARPDHAPVLAHFYIWFTASSWGRAKDDYPAVGRYSSDDAGVMRHQVDEARAAGIDGFIVSWKDSPSLDARLATLRTIAAQRGFSLALTYEAEDFGRHPLPPDQVRHDLEQFAATYGDDPVFHVLGSRPLVALTGTDNYSPDQLRSIIAPVASRLTVLATEKSVAGYQRVASLVDGELYYWSSGDPETTPGYAAKLLAMANVVRANCGLWVAPVAPGFDARKVGGSTVVPRRDGGTLRASWRAALATVPDAMGVISWNEFSESTYIEPSEDDGTRYLDVLHQLIAAPSPPAKELDSGGPDGPGQSVRAVLTLSVAGAGMLLVTGLGMYRRRAGRLPG